MRKILSVLLMAGISLSCSPRKTRESMLLNRDLVDLKGRPTFTIIINSTRDTLKLEAAIYGMIPIAEEYSDLTIAPGERDTLAFSQSYPDFIYLTNNQIDLKVFNAPGRELICDIRSTKPGNSEVVFTGSLSQINDYYLAHQNHFGANYEHNRPYFLAGDTVKNFDHYPAIVDSISGMSRSFLKHYKAALPEWFVPYENARLNFKSGLIKHNCPATKEFYEARTIPKSPSYFDFDKSLSLNDSNIVLCHDYLSYAAHRIHHIAKDKKSHDKLRFEYHLVDSLYGASVLGDLQRVGLLSFAALGSLPEFRDQLAEVNFGDSTYRTLIDSLVREKLGVPKVGKFCPDPLLSDVKGDQVLLSSYKGNVLLLNFWATWCGPCIDEFPSENEIHNKYGGKGFLIVNICVESKEEKWRLLTNEHELKMINLFYSPDEYASLKKAFDLSGFPRSVLVGKDFVVMESHAVRASKLKESDILEWIGEK